jgi:hypothetical protein
MAHHMTPRHKTKSDEASAFDSQFVKKTANRYAGARFLQSQRTCALNTRGIDVILSKI